MFCLEDDVKEDDIKEDDHSSEISSYQVEIRDLIIENPLPHLIMK